MPPTLNHSGLDNRATLVATLEETDGRSFAEGAGALMQGFSTSLDRVQPEPLSEYLKKDK